MMKQLLILLVCCVVITEESRAQDFITRGKIEFEIKQNNKRMMTDRHPDMDFGISMPEFDISYRDLVFSGGRLLYSPSRKGTSKSPIKTTTLYTNLDTRQIISKQGYMDEQFLLEDSVRPIKWKIENEIRKIAGFECRKAIGRFHDSVYVVAFYCPEIIPQGGPEFFAGLPGMILGLAIPRFYTTWFATRVELASLDEANVVPPTIKNSQPQKKQELATMLYKKYKDSGWLTDLTPEKVLSALDIYTYY
jgi:GLPGLI family protein